MAYRMLLYPLVAWMPRASLRRPKPNRQKMHRRIQSRVLLASPELSSSVCMIM